MQRNETEYAKIIRWYPRQTAYGIRMDVTLPTAAKIGGRRGNGFFNFYLAGSGIEAGLSSSVTEVAQGQWHWFCHGGTGDNGQYVYKGGDTHKIEFSMDGKNLNFIVDRSVKRTIATKNNNLTDPRIIIAACDQDYNATPPKPLDAWNTTMNQVVCSNIEYKNAAGDWVTFSSQPDATDRFPALSGYPHVGTPQDFVRVVSSGKIIASLKK